MSNAYDPSRGNTTDRQRRKQWLLETYRADADGELIIDGETGRQWVEWVPLGHGVPACRCYRCGKLLTIDTLTVDRIIPGCKGGTYRRNNIRPSCSDCANHTGGKLSAETRNRLPVVRPRVPELAARDASTGSRSEGPVPVPGVQPPRTSGLRRNGAVEG